MSENILLKRGFTLTELFFEKTYSPYSSEEIIEKEKHNMDDYRFQHCIRVSKTSKKLAKLYHYDEDKAAIAGFVHDYAKQEPVAEFIKAIKTQGFDQDLLNWNPAIWHGIVGTYFIKRDLKIDDPEILQAVNRHTTGDVEMTLLDKIVFMADYIEPGRKFDGVKKARELALTDLDEAVGYQLRETLKLNIDKQNRIYPRSVAAYNVWGVK